MPCKLCARRLVAQEERDGSIAATRHWLDTHYWLITVGWSSSHAISPLPPLLFRGSDGSW